MPFNKNLLKKAASDIDNLAEKNVMEFTNRYMGRT
jgi:hypothetical protein